MKPKLTNIEFVFHNGQVVYTATGTPGEYLYEVFDAMDRPLGNGTTRQAANKTNASNILETALKGKG